MKNETLCHCGQPRNHWHHDRDKVLDMVQKSPPHKPMNQDVTVEIWSIPYEALLPHPNIERYLDENPIGGNWTKWDDDDPWMWSPPSRASHLAGSVVMSNHDLFKASGNPEQLEKIMKDLATNAAWTLFKELARVEGYQGKTPEQLEADKAEIQKRFEAGPPKEDDE